MKWCNVQSAVVDSDLNGEKNGELLSPLEGVVQKKLLTIHDEISLFINCNSKPMFSYVLLYE